MLKKTITFKDFSDNPREVDLYFNLTESELIDLQIQSNGGIQEEMLAAVRSNDMPKILAFFKMVVHKSYGVKDADGLHFRKSPEILDEFINSAMYSPFMLSLFEDEGRGAERFINGLMPADLVTRAQAQMQGQTVAEAAGFQNDARDVFAARQAAVREAAAQSLSDAMNGQYVETGSVDPQAFRVKEEPIGPTVNVVDEAATRAREDAAFAEYQEWKRQREAEQL